MLSGAMLFTRVARLGLAAVALIAAARPAAAAVELAAAGAAFELRDAAAVLARLQPETPALRRGTAEVAERVVAGHRVAVVRIPVRGEGRVEEWLVEIGVRPARVLWGGMIGPRDSDAEVAVHLEIGDDEILEYQTAAQVGRCDGQPARLFPRAWDFEAERFRPVLSPLPAAPSATIVARRDDPGAPLGRPAGGFRWVAASTTAAEGRDARGLTAPTALDDGDPATVWAEGLGGDGRGEFLTARASSGAAPIIGLRIVPGDARTSASFHERNRLRRFLLTLGPGADQRFTVEIPSDPATGSAWQRPYWVPLPRPMASACVTIVLDDVYRGSEAAPPRSFGTTAIADIDIFTDVDRP
ncbi:MAG TPA: hypothetical protein VMU50_16540, partial [Polyangia bacterium]|nr:hypothetical protein [Polyangia bacterium]